MEIGQRVADLRDPDYGLLLRQRAEAAQHGLQIFALYVVHHEVLPGPGQGEVVGDAGQVGMRQMGQ